jgi:uncharacterized membrane protein YkvA (DUF1232 family)
MKLLQRLQDAARRLRRDGLTLWFACRHPATPWHAKALALVTVAYALSPIDLIPDFIPLLGYLDDLLLLPALIWLCLRLTPATVVTDCRAQADAWIERGRAKPRSWAGAIGIVLLWTALAGWLAWLWLRR